MMNEPVNGYIYPTTVIHPFISSGRDPCFATQQFRFTLLSNKGALSFLTGDSYFVLSKHCHGGSHNQIKQVLNSTKFILQSKSFRIPTTLVNHRFSDVRGN